MDGCRAGFAHHLYQLHERVAANDGILHQKNGPTAKRFPVGRVFLRRELQALIRAMAKKCARTHAQPGAINTEDDWQPEPKCQRDASVSTGVHHWNDTIKTSRNLSEANHFIGRGRPARRAEPVDAATARLLEVQIL